MTRKGTVFGSLPMVRYSLAHLVEWGDHLSVEHPAIDAQHQVIFERVAEVHDLWRRNADLADLRAAVDRLNSVLEVHFRYEERMLAETAYPNLAAHAAEHRALLGELASMRARLSGDGKAPPESGWALIGFLLGVTVGHIVSSDIEYCHYVAANPVDELDVSIAAMEVG
jgi:hemerythrin-like metal-binding protein